MFPMWGWGSVFRPPQNSPTRAVMQCERWEAGSHLIDLWTEIINMARQSSTRWPRPEVIKGHRCRTSGLAVLFRPAPVRLPCSMPAAKWSWMPSYLDLVRAVQVRMEPSPVPNSPRLKVIRIKAAALWWRRVPAEVASRVEPRLRVRRTGAWDFHRTAPTPAITARITNCRLPHPARRTTVLNENYAVQDGIGRKANRLDQTTPARLELCGQLTMTPVLDWNLSGSITMNRFVDNLKAIIPD